MKLKVCGMKYNPEEVAALEPDYLGFIFWANSPRCYSKKALPDLPPKVMPVGVFVDELPEVISDLSARLGFAALQLHGRETSDYCRDLRRQLCTRGMEEVKIIKAFSIGEAFGYDNLDSYLRVCDYFLFDTKGELPGGSGRTFDWELLKAYPFDKPYFLSGGIGEAQCGKLLDFVRSASSRFCIGIDVNSRFETEPGTKDTKALKRFLSCDFWKEAGRGSSKFTD